MFMVLNIFFRKKRAGNATSIAIMYGKRVADLIQTYRKIFCTQIKKLTDIKCNGKKANLTENKTCNILQTDRFSA